MADGWIEPAAEWRARAGESAAQLVLGVLPASGVAGLAAEPKSLKTWLALAVVVAVATGRSLFGRYEVERPGRCLLVLTEGGHAATALRLEALGRGAGAGVDEVDRNVDVIWRRGVQLDDPGFARTLAERAPAYALILVDVFRDAWGGDENKADHVGRLMRYLHGVAASGPTVLLVHHLSKPPMEQVGMRRPGHRLRGSSAFYGSLDAVLYLEHQGEDGRVRVSLEARDDIPAEPFTIGLPPERVTRESAVTLDWQPADRTRAATIELHELLVAFVRRTPGCSQNEVLQAIPGKTAVKNQAIRQLLEAGRLFQREAVHTRSDGQKRRGPGLYAEPDEQDALVFPDPRETVGKRYLEAPLLGVSQTPPLRGDGETVGAAGNGRAAQGVPGPAVAGPR